MGKNKTKNRNKPRNAKHNGSCAPIVPELQAASRITSGTSTSSSAITRGLSTSISHDGTSERPSSLPSEPVSRSQSGVAKDKRDVVSSTWDDRSLELKQKARSYIPWAWSSRLRQWSPCCAYRWCGEFVKAYRRTIQGPRWPDATLTLIMAFVAIFVGYVGVDLLLTILKGASAQSIAADPNCSIVYVNVPGPVITVSLINASPSHPAQGTYYYSMVDGTTQWMNSIAPPSAFSTSMTRTPEITPTMSSVSATSTIGDMPTLPSLSTSQPTTVISSLALSSASSPLLASSTSTLSGTLFNIPSIITSTTITTLTSIIPGGQTTYLTKSVTMTMTQGLSRPTNVPPPPTMTTTTTTVLLTITSTLPGGQTVIVTSISTALIGSPPPVSSSNNSPPAPSDTVQSLISGTPVGMTSTGPGLAPSSLSPTSTSYAPSSLALMTSTVLTLLTSTIPGGSTTTLTRTAVVVVGPSSISGTYSSSSPGNTKTLPIPLVTTTILTRTISGSSTTQTLLLTTIPTVTASSSVSRSDTTGSGIVIPSTRLSGTTSSTPGLSVFTWPSAIGPSTTSSASTPRTTGLTTVAASRANSTQASSTTTVTGGSRPPELFSTLLNQTTTSTTLTSISSTSSRTTAGLSSAGSFSSVVNTLAPPADTSSFNSRSSRFPSSTLSTISSSATIALSSSLAPSRASTFSTATVTGFMTIQTETTARLSTVTTAPSPAATASFGTDNTSPIAVREVTTRVISYGDMAYSFVFPTPDITTTISYWTGVYPTVTGPLPSDLQTISPTTRSVWQIPGLALPPLELLSSSRRSFRTIVTTIYDDEEPGQGMARREAAAQIAETVLDPLPNSTPTRAEMSAVESPGPTSCGESGNFTLDFDDTTVNSSGDQILIATGLKNPYHHMFYANGYTNVPDKWEPYPAISQPNVAMFLPLTGHLLPNQPFTGTLLPGEVGAGPRASVSAYWFNAFSGYFGCALNGLTPCLFRIWGYRYDATLRQEVLVAEQNTTIPACYGYIRCRLTQVSFNEQFRGLSGIQFNAFTSGLGIPQAHMMDDLQMEWYNNTCAAGILRIGHW